MPEFTKRVDIVVDDFEVEIDIDVDEFMDEADIDEVIDECISRDSDQVISKMIGADMTAVEEALKSAKGDLNEPSNEPVGEKVRQLRAIASDEAILRCMMLQASIADITSTAVKLALSTLDEVAS